MTLLTAAKDVLKQAENSLKDLIYEGIDADRYGEVALLVELLEGVAKLCGANMDEIPENKYPNYISTDIQKRTGRVRKGATESTDLESAVPKRKYPCFERDDYNLIKVGWSRRQQSEYEHKAPRATVAAFCRILAERASDTTRFTMEELLPATQPDGNRIPDYQAYLVVAWLRSRNVLKKQGRGTYRLNDSFRVVEGFEEEWKSLPVRAEVETDD